MDNEMTAPGSAATRTASGAPKPVGAGATHSTTPGSTMPDGTRAPVAGTPGDMMAQVQEQVRPQIESQKDRVADQVGMVANALRQTGQNLNRDEAGPLADYADRGAEQIEQFSQYLRNHDLTDLVGEVEDFARRQPTLFMAGAFGLGLLAARFLRSRPMSGSGAGGYGGGSYERSRQYLGGQSPYQDGEGYNRMMRAGDTRARLQNSRYTGGQPGQGSQQLQHDQYGTQGRPTGGQYAGSDTTQRADANNSTTGATKGGQYHERQYDAGRSGNPSALGSDGGQNEQLRR